VPILNEKHPEDVQILRGAMRGTPAAAHARDACERWVAMVPTRTARVVVVVDPPYEQTGSAAASLHAGSAPTLTIRTRRTPG
jgi:23S rRNA (adenine2030-N6)-methyltransferase